MVEFTKLASLVGHKDRAWEAAFHPTENLLATCGSDLCIKLWKLAPDSPLLQPVVTVCS